MRADADCHWSPIVFQGHWQKAWHWPAHTDRIIGVLHSQYTANPAENRSEMKLYWIHVLGVFVTKVLRKMGEPLCHHQTSSLIPKESKPSSIGRFSSQKKNALLCRQLIHTSFLEEDSHVYSTYPLSSTMTFTVFRCLTLVSSLPGPDAEWFPVLCMLRTVSFKLWGQGSHLWKL